MSRIFDALQRSGTEQSGVEYPDMVSVITEVFELQPPPDCPPTDEATNAEPITAQTVPVQPIAVQPATLEPLSPEVDLNGLAEFPSLEVSVPPSSRLVFLTEPESLAAEKFRFLGVRLRQLQQTRPLKKVLVTSTIPEEGKSTVSANLAGVLARRKQRVLLIEGDLRRPVMSEKFGLGRLAGLGEWLQSGRHTVTNVYRLDGPNFWLLPAGNPPANPLELLQSGRLADLMGQLSNLFDWIIVDSPPLLPLADTTVWARVTDGALLVAREGKSEKTQLQRGLEILKKSDLLGVVLNCCSDHNNYYQQYAYQRPSARKPNEPGSSLGE
ncbi:MAG: CpsD/CapB family tyrosine-protein kinase [Candidatus Sulfotelmatobacter sp.]